MKLTVMLAGIVRDPIIIEEFKDVFVFISLSLEQKMSHKEQSYLKMFYENC